MGQRIVARSRAHDRSDGEWAKKKIELDRDGLSADPERDIAIDMRLSRYESAIRRWVDALNGRVDRARVEAAVHPEVRVVRWGFGTNVGQVVQDIQGTSGVAEWFGMTPATVEFDIAGPVEVEAEPSLESGDSTGGKEAGSVARAQYQVMAPDFLGGGIWNFRLAEDDRIIWLEHRPDDIPDPVQEGTSRSGANREHSYDDPHHVEHHH